MQDILCKGIVVTAPLTSRIKNEEGGHSPRAYEGQVYTIFLNYTQRFSKSMNIIRLNHLRKIKSNH